MLTKKEQDFCAEYVKDYNGTQAYIRAYGAAYDTACSRAAQVLKKPEIRERIHLLEKDVFEANCINAEHIANELASMAFGVVSQDSRLSYNDKAKALELLGKQLSLYTNKVDLNATNVININITGDEDASN